jgi:hypothetical protein
VGLRGVGSLGSYTIIDRKGREKDFDISNKALGKNINLIEYIKKQHD